MQTNALPKYETSLNLTGCCPKFDPAGWDDQELHLREMPFVRAISQSIGSIPVDMDSVFGRVLENILDAGAFPMEGYIALSRAISENESEHFFAVTKPVPDETMTTLSGDFITKVFEGPHDSDENWQAEMEQIVRDRGSEPGRIFFFYTTCPKCAEEYGQNYVVGVAEI